MIGAGRGRCDHVEISPVDPDEVSSLLQNRLLFAADAQGGDAAELKARRHDFLCGAVDGKLAGGIEVERDGMFFAVLGLRGPGHVGCWTRHYIQIGGQRGSHERQRDGDAGGFELINRPGGQHLQLALLHCGDLLRFVADDAVRFAVDANQATELLRGSGPVTGRIVGKVIGHRPDAEIRTVCNQWNGGRTKILGHGAGESE